jgi:hypothetical protein
MRGCPPSYGHANKLEGPDGTVPADAFEATYRDEIAGVPKDAAQLGARLDTLLRAVRAQCGNYADVVLARHLHGIAAQVVPLSGQSIRKAALSLRTRTWSGGAGP